AYLAGQPGGLATLHLMNADGTNDEAVNGATAVSSSTAPGWSHDSLLVAFAQGTSGGQILEVYNAVTKQTRALGRVEGLSAAGRPHWLPDTLPPAVTWATRDDLGPFTGIFAEPALDPAKPRRLTPTSLLYSAADFSPNYKGGVWLASSAGAQSRLALISATGS